MAVNDTNEQPALVITNFMVWEKICKIEEAINGNGKKGIKEVLAELCLSVRVQWGFISFIILALVGGAIKLFL